MQVSAKTIYTVGNWGWFPMPPVLCYCFALPLSGVCSDGSQKERGNACLVVEPTAMCDRHDGDLRARPALIQGYYGSRHYGDPQRRVFCFCFLSLSEHQSLGHSESKQHSAHTAQ